MYSDFGSGAGRVWNLRQSHDTLAVGGPWPDIHVRHLLVAVRQLTVASCQLRNIAIGHVEHGLQHKHPLIRIDVCQPTRRLLVHHLFGKPTHLKVVNCGLMTQAWLGASIVTLDPALWHIKVLLEPDQFVFFYHLLSLGGRSMAQECQTDGLHNFLRHLVLTFKGNLHHVLFSYRYEKKMFITEFTYFAVLTSNASIQGADIFLYGRVRHFVEI